RSALFTVSKPKPECSRSNSTKSQPADFRICPMPGVANSTTKWPNFAGLLPVMALRPRSLMVNFLPYGSLCDPSLLGRLRGGALGGRTRADQVVFLDGLVGDERRARLVEDREMRCLQVQIEGCAVVIDLVEQDMVRVFAVGA